MAEKIVIVEGRQFKSLADIKAANEDKEKIEKLREMMKKLDLDGMRRLQKNLAAKKYGFQTILGEDFADEVDERVRQLEKEQGLSRKQKEAVHQVRSAGVRVAAEERKTGRKASNGVDAKRKAEHFSPEIEEQARTVLKKRDKRRKIIIWACVITALLCLGYFGAYTYFDYRTSLNVQVLQTLKEQNSTATASAVTGPTPTPVVIHYDNEDIVVPEVLDEYKDLLKKNKRLIGWIKIVDITNGKKSPFIDLPVMQTTDNEYYLTHNMEQEYDKNGTIFMDKDCDVIRESTNYILYGHHMRSGKMFGQLDKYEDREFCEDHPYIYFDTIYEKGTYQVMYVFRSHVFAEEEVAFKYYQFIEAYSEVEFDSYMNEMASMSLYDTGVTAQYGDHLLTLSTCDYEEKNGRFVVVAKKID